MLLHHRDFGGEGREPLLVLHGLLGSSRNWQMTGRDLAADFHVLGLDLRNHGASPHHQEMNYGAMAGDVLRWMDTQGLTRVRLMGHSMGGKVAMLLACRHPERVGQLVVVDIAPKDYLSYGHRAEFAAMNELHLPSLSSRAQAELHLEARVPDLGMRKFLVTNLGATEAGGFKWQVNLPVLTASLSELEENPLAETDHYVGPALFVTGGRSHYVQPGDWAGILHHFPQAQAEIIAESGHNPHMDARPRFVELVKRFLLP